MAAMLGETFVTEVLCIQVDAMKSLMTILINRIFSNGSLALGSRVQAGVNFPAAHFKVQRCCPALGHLIEYCTLGRKRNTATKGPGNLQRIADLINLIH